ncbi:type II toxin-antitoxin system VapC family toxin [Acidobacteriota bacterium]
MAIAASLKGFIKKHSHLSLDTSVFIYFVEHNPRYHDLSKFIFEAIETGKIKATTSTLSLLEILVQPYRRQLDDLVMKFYGLFTTYPNLEWVELTLEIADTAARLRAEHRLKTPDAIQLASALSSGATGFICNDVIFKRVEEIDCLILDDCTE